MIRSIPLILFSGFLCWIIFDANRGASNVFFNFAAALPWGDKLGHFILFGVLTLFANIALQFRFFWLGNTQLPIGSLIVLGLACAEELSQWTNLNRTFDLVDLLCGILGILFMSLLNRRRLVVEVD
jgi:hypothetical protein